MVSSQGWLLSVYSVVPLTEAHLYHLILSLRFQFSIFWEAGQNQNHKHHSQYKHTVIITDNSVMMFSILVSIPPPPGLYYSIYFLSTDEN